LVYNSEAILEILSVGTEREAVLVLLAYLQDACEEVGRMRYELRSAHVVTQTQPFSAVIWRDILEKAEQASRRRFEIPEFIEVSDEKRMPYA